MQPSFSKTIAHAFIRNAVLFIDGTVLLKMREELPFPDKVLQTLHNLCATAADLARRGDDVASAYAERPKRD